MINSSTYNAVLKEKIITSFIVEKPSRKQLIYNYFFKGDRSNNDLLNKEFKSYFYKIRLIKYVTTLYEKFSTYYRTTSLKKRYREPAVLDKPVLEDSAISLMDKLSSHSDEVKYCIETPERGFEGIVSNEEILRKIKSLNELQKIILWRSVIQEKSLKEISEQLNVSVQNVSQIKKRTISRLRGGINE